MHGGNADVFSKMMTFVYRVGQNPAKNGDFRMILVTRAEAVTMLGRMQNTEGVVPADLSVFSDAASVPAYALEHFQTMVSLGVISGNEGKLDPNGTMTRAAICKILATLP